VFLDFMAIATIVATGRKRRLQKADFRIMAKCRKVLSSGRCSKNAVEGRKLCAAYVRIADKAALKPKRN
jgi:hypothetical protein